MWKLVGFVQNVRAKLKALLVKDGEKSKLEIMKVLLA